MLIFLYGQDTYRIKNKISEIIAEYSKKYSSGLNLAKIDMADNDISALHEQIGVVSMFLEKKLIILNNVFGDNKKEKDILGYFTNKKIVEDKEVIVIVSRDNNNEKIKLLKSKTKKTNALNEDSGLLKFLLKNSKCQEFKPFNMPQLRRWIVIYLKGEGFSIDEIALTKLVDYVGNDLWQMDMEIRKLVSYKTGSASKIIKEGDVEDLVKPKININIFSTIDSLARKNRGDALGLLRKHFEESENALYLLSMFTYQFRNIIKIKDLIERNFSDREISKEMKAHPYVLQKSISQAKLFSLAELKKIYRMFFQVDLSIKTGRIKPETALDLLVMEITK